MNLTSQQTLLSFSLIIRKEKKEKVAWLLYLITKKKYIYIYVHGLQNMLHTWQIAVLVLFEVAIQVGLLTEAAVAQVALKRLLLVVDVANVTL